jgi:hypothetical protein
VPANGEAKGKSSFKAFASFLKNKKSELIKFS